MLLCWPTRLRRIERRGVGRHSAPVLLMVHITCQQFLTRLLWFCVFSVLKVSVLWQFFHMSPRCKSAELAGRKSVTLLLPMCGWGPRLLSLSPSACLPNSPVEATLILGNVSCWFIFYCCCCFVFVWEKIYIYIYKYIDIYHYRIMH